MNSPTATERVYRHLKTQIINGQLPGGEMISEGQVATDMSVSRTPVREAFLRLEAEGYMRLYPKRGAVIVPITPKEADELLDARLLIEAHAATKICKQPQELRQVLCAKLTTIIEAQEASVKRGDLITYSTLDSEFHHTVMNAGANSLLSGFFYTIKERQQRLIHASVGGNEHSAKTFIAGHRELVEHLRNSDFAAYKETLEHHLSLAEKIIK